MENAKEIRNRIESIRETRKITNAMYLIATNKLRKAKQRLQNTRPYFDALENEIGQIFRIAPEVKSRYFSGDAKIEPESQPVCCLVITADKGLAGTYNHNVLKLAEKLLDTAQTAKLYVVGSYGRQYFKKKGMPYADEFLYSAQNPTIHRARKIAGELLERYNAGEFSGIRMIYTDYKNALTEEAKEFTLLPLTREQYLPKQDDGEAQGGGYEYLPGVRQVLDSIVPTYVTGLVYSALVAAFCCEQNARMTAMDAAGKNAQAILQTLSMEYNRVRQNAITEEITEITAGARAQRMRLEEQQKEVLFE